MNNKIIFIQFLLIKKLLIMKTNVSLMKIGIGIEMPCKPNTNYLISYTEKSIENFYNWIYKYNFKDFNIDLRKVEHVNICGIIGITFDVLNIELLNINKIIKFIQSEANKRIKTTKQLNRY